MATPIGSQQQRPSDQQPMLERTCKNCKKASSIDKPLFPCSNCGRYYHSTCHRPTPPFPFPKTGWTCSSSRCKPPRTALDWIWKAVYHGGKPPSSDSISTKSSASPRSHSRAGEMAAGPGASFTPDSIHGADDLSPAKCAFPDCFLGSRGNSRFCIQHARGPHESQTVSKTGQAHDSPHRSNKTRLPPEHEPGSVLPITRRKTGTTATLGPLLGQRSSSSLAPQRSPDDGIPKAHPPEKKKTSSKREAMSPPESALEDGPVKKKARLDTAKSESPGGLNIDKPTSSTKPRQPRRNLYAKSAPGFALQFQSEVSSPASNGTSWTNGATKSTSPLNNTQAGKQQLPDLYKQSKSDASVKSKRSSSVAEGAAVPRAASSATEDRRKVPEPHRRLPQQRNPPPLSKPPPPRRHSLEEQLFPGSPNEATIQKQSSPRENPPWHQLFLPSPPNNPIPLDSVQIKRPYSLPFRSTVSEVEFDSLIYSQEGAASPPPGVVVQPAVRPPPPPGPPKNAEDGPFFMHIDPRQHWPQPHSKEWFEKKQKEIMARGGRKANFGKAVERMKARGPVTFEDRLPRKIRENPKWVRALKSLEEQGQEVEKERKASASGPRGAQKERPAAFKRHASAPGASSSRQP